MPQEKETEESKMQESLLSEEAFPTTEKKREVKSKGNS